MISDEEKAILAKDFELLALTMGENASKNRVIAMVQVMSEYDFVKTRDAIKQAITTCKFFPRPAELIEIMEPSVGKIDSDYLVGRIMQAVTTFGQYRYEDAAKSLPNEAIGAIKMAGGWLGICETPQGQIGTLRAQLRGYCDAAIHKEGIINRLEIRDAEYNKNEEQLENESKPYLMNFDESAKELLKGDGFY